jgi:hypothetical protein
MTHSGITINAVTSKSFALVNDMRHLWIEMRNNPIEIKHTNPRVKCPFSLHISLSMMPQRQCGCTIQYAKVHNFEFIYLCTLLQE